VPPHIRSYVLDAGVRHSLRSSRRITRTSYRRTGGAKPTKMPLMPRLPLITLSAVGVWTVGGLLLDRHVGHTGQLGLGLLTVCVLAVLLAFHPRVVRLQTLAVIVIATVGEVVGSIIWGLYTYRLENLPAFVPPGHGLVYLAGLSLAALMRDRATVLLVAAGAAAATWGIAGVTALPAPDVSGTIGCAFLIGVLLWARRPVYAGVFMVVLVLELYGTALGTWTWEPTVPGLGLSQGNPPSGVASGYVVFDVLALALVARLSGLGAALQSMRERRAAASTVVPASISPRAESTLSQTSQSRNPRALPSPST
jgi:hypothetical protein